MSDFGALNLFLFLLFPLHFLVWHCIVTLQVVTDKALHLEEDKRVVETVVPTSYKTKSGTEMFISYKKKTGTPCWDKLSIWCSMTEQ